MQEILDFFSLAGVFLLGLLVRLLALVALMALFAIPVIAVVGIYRAFEDLRARRLARPGANGLRVAQGRHYTPGHVWLWERLFGRLKVGLDDLAQSLVPGITSVVLPEPGAVLTQGQTAVKITCGSRQVDVPAPVTGVVSRVNFALASDPGLLHRSPYSEGWLFTVRPKDLTYRDFPFGNQAMGWFRKEKERLDGLLESRLGMAAADGGELIAAPAALLAAHDWKEIVESFVGPVEHR